MTPEKLKKLTIAFMITKVSMSTLPELSLISVKQYNPNTPISTFNSSNLYPLFLLVGCMVTLVFGLIWLVFMRRYLLQLKQEGDINALLLQHTSQNETYFTQKNLYFRIAMAFSLIIVAVVFALDLIFDDVNVMPDIISAALFASAMFLLRPHSQNATLAGGMFCLYGGIGLVSYILKGIFVHRYTFEMIEYAPKAKNLYLTHTIFSGLEGVLLVIALVALSYVVLNVCQTHNPKGDLGTQAILRKKLRIFVGIGILSALASFYYVISVSQTHPLGIGDNPFGTSGLVYVPVIEWYWMVPLAISLVWIGYAVHLMGALRDAYKDLAE